MRLILAIFISIASANYDTVLLRDSDFDPDIWAIINKTACSFSKYYEQVYYSPRDFDLVSYILTNILNKTNETIINNESDVYDIMKEENSEKIMSDYHNLNESLFVLPEETVNRTIVLLNNVNSTIIRILLTNDTNSFNRIILELHSDDKIIIWRIQKEDCVHIGVINYCYKFVSDCNKYWSPIKFDEENHDVFDGLIQTKIDENKKHLIASDIVHLSEIKFSEPYYKALHYVFADNEINCYTRNDNYISIKKLNRLENDLECRNLKEFVEIQSENNFNSTQLYLLIDYENEIRIIAEKDSNYDYYYSVYDLLGRNLIKINCRTNKKNNLNLFQYGNIIQNLNQTASKKIYEAYKYENIILNSSLILIEKRYENKSEIELDFFELVEHPNMKTSDGIELKYYTYIEDDGSSHWKIIRNINNTNYTSVFEL